MKTQKKSSKAKNKTAKVSKVVNIAVVLEDVPKEREMMRKMAANDPTFNYTVCPKNADQFYAYIHSLRKRGIQVSKMLLMGHGNAINHHIGGFFPGDADIGALRSYLKKAKDGYAEAKLEQKRLRRKLQKVKTKKEKEALKAAIQYAHDEEVNRNEARKDYENKITLMDEMSESMAPGARIGLFNCYGASDKKAEQFMNNIGEIFLHKNGGDIIGCSDKIWTVSTHPVVESLFGTYDTSAYPWGKWKTHAVAATAGHCNGHNHKPTCTCGWGGPR